LVHLLQFREGVITDGHLLHAGSSSLVDIGHTQVDPYGKRCYCGNHGCLETIASVDPSLTFHIVRHSWGLLVSDDFFALAALFA
ncbi:ROK family protein, partial [Escherichia coli]|nr:ROK family protein [Escherichia coli]